MIKVGMPYSSVGVFKIHSWVRILWYFNIILRINMMAHWVG